MGTIASDTRLERVEHILGSGTGTLDFAIEGESEYYTWHGKEDADWEIEKVSLVENDTEDRFVIYPDSEYFICEIEASDEEENVGAVRCWCPE